MESNPTEAVKNNILGTRTIAEIAGKTEIVKIAEENAWFKKVMESQKGFGIERSTIVERNRPVANGLAQAPCDRGSVERNSANRIDRDLPARNDSGFDQQQPGDYE